MSDKSTGRQKSITPLLFISVIMIGAGICIIVAGVVSYVRGFRNTATNVLMILAALMVIGGGMLLFNYIKKLKGHPELRPAKAAFIVLPCVLAALGVMCAAYLSESFREIELNNTISFTASEEKGDVPSDPKFVFYDLKRQTYEYPDASSYSPYAAKTIDEANVVVLIGSYTGENGRWVGVADGKDYGPAKYRKLTIRIHRLDNGALIDSKETTEDLAYGASGNGTSPERWIETQNFIKDTLGGE